MTIYHNPRCKKSKETLELLKANKVDPQIIEYLKTPPKNDELKSLLGKLNKKPLDIIRKQEKVFKENYKGKDLPDEEWINIMVENPILIERPIVVKDDKAVLGRPPENVHALLN